MNNALKQVMTDRRLNIKSKAIYSYFNGLCFDKNTCYPSRGKITYDLNGQCPERRETKNCR